MLVQDGLPPPARYRAMVVIILGIALSILDSEILTLPYEIGFMPAAFFL